MMKKLKFRWITTLINFLSFNIFPRFTIQGTGNLLDKKKICVAERVFHKQWIGGKDCC